MRDISQATGVPVGLRLRPYAGEADVPAIVGISNAENEADRIPSRWSVGEALADYRHASPSFDARRDVTVAEIDDRPVAVASREWIDTTDGELREYRVGGDVHPEWRRRGIGAALLEHNEERSRALAAAHETDRRKVFGSFTGEHQAGAIALLEQNGYTPVRWFFDMVRPTLDEIPEVPLPDGLEVRPLGPDQYSAVWKADAEAFRDHWGGFDDSPQAFQRFLDMPEFDPSLWVIAWDGDDIAGGVLNTIYPEENEALGVQRGWLDSVFTRRPWRRRGLARALIARSLVALKQRGMMAAVLGVDADNPSGALGLYEGVGFAVDTRYTAWRKPMDAR
jgi:mycothiol synthase